MNVNPRLAAKATDLAELVRVGVSQPRGSVERLESFLSAAKRSYELEGMFQVLGIEARQPMRRSASQLLKAVAVEEEAAKAAIAVGDPQPHLRAALPFIEHKTLEAADGVMSALGANRELLAPGGTAALDDAIEAARSALHAELDQPLRSVATA